jgi:hypothetical protein
MKVTFELALIPRDGDVTCSVETIDMDPHAAAMFHDPRNLVLKGQRYEITGSVFDVDTGMLTIAARRYGSSLQGSVTVSAEEATQ